MARLSGRGEAGAGRIISRGRLAGAFFQGIVKTLVEASVSPARPLFPHDEKKPRRGWPKAGLLERYQDSKAVWQPRRSQIGTL